jgi:hypothetical protein
MGMCGFGRRETLAFFIGRNFYRSRWELHLITLNFCPITAWVDVWGAGKRSRFLLAEISIGPDGTPPHYFELLPHHRLRRCLNRSFPPEIFEPSR